MRRAASLFRGWRIALVALALHATFPAQPLIPQTSLANPEASAVSGETDVAYLASPEELLQLDLDRVLRGAVGERATVGAEVRSLSRGDTLYSLNAERLLQPASNVKLFTAAGALHYLGPNFVFRTTVHQTGPVEAGVLHGHLVLEGRGDPNLSGRFYADSVPYVFDRLAEALRAQGITRVAGDLVGDNRYFEGPPMGEGWPWDTQQWWYSAQIDALSFNDNTVTVFALPGPAVGAPARILTAPATSYLSVRNEVSTVARRSGARVWVQREQGTNVVTVGGQVPVRGRGASAIVSVHEPARFALSVFRDRLARAGLRVDGATRLVEEGDPPRETWTPVATHLSPPLSETIKVVNKKSQNFYAEQVLKTIGAEVRGRGTAESGIRAIDEFLQREVGVDPGAIYMVDGSGLSRLNLVTAGAIVRLLEHMARHPYGRDFLESLAVAGEDEVSPRLNEPLTRGNVRAKTGTVRYVSAYSGYVTAANGEQIAFSILLNNRPQGKGSSVLLENAVVRALARFTR